MGFKCNHGKEYSDINDAIECDLRSHFLDKHTLTAGRGNKRITQWQAALGANGLPIFAVFKTLGEEGTRGLPKDMFGMMMGQSIKEIAYLVSRHPEVIEDMLNEAKAIHARLSGFNAGDAIKAAAAAGSKHTD